MEELDFVAGALQRGRTLAFVPGSDCGGPRPRAWTSPCAAPASAAMKFGRGRGHVRAVAATGWVPRVTSPRREVVDDLSPRSILSSVARSRSSASSTRRFEPRSPIFRRVTGLHHLRRGSSPDRTGDPFRHRRRGARCHRAHDVAALRPSGRAGRWHRSFAGRRDRDARFGPAASALADSDAGREVGGRRRCRAGDPPRRRAAFVAEARDLALVLPDTPAHRVDRPACRRRRLPAHLPACRAGLSISWASTTAPARTLPPGRFRQLLCCSDPKKRGGAPSTEPRTRLVRGERHLLVLEVPLRSARRAARARR